MEVLDKVALRSWLEKRHIFDYRDGRGWLHYSLVEPHSVALTIPTTPPQIAAMLYSLLAREEGNFGGSMLLLTDWDIWSEQIEEVGQRLLDRMRLGYGIKEPLIQTPTHLFNENEFLDQRAFSVLPLFFGWDAFLIPDHGRYFLFFSHDEKVFSVSESNKVKKEWSEYISTDLREEEPPYFQMLNQKH